MKVSSQYAQVLPCCQARTLSHETVALLCLRDVVNMDLILREWDIAEVDLVPPDRNVAEVDVILCDRSLVSDTNYRARALDILVEY